MDISGSQYNSASESGWTHYLDQSSLSENEFQGRGGIVDYEGNGGGARVEDEEDLSMVSDASSGPPHYHDQDDGHHFENWCPSTSQYTKESGKKKNKEYGARNLQPSALEFDDTASSPVLTSSKASHKNALDFSQDLSAARIKGKSKFQKHFSFFQRSLPGKQASEETGGFKEEDRK